MSGLQGVQRELKSHTHGHKYQSRLRIKTNQQTKNLINPALYWLETAPLHSDALGDGTHHSRLLFGRDGTYFMRWASSPFCLGCWFPLRKDKPLGRVGRVLKTGKRKRKKINGFLTFLFRRLWNIRLICVGGWDSMDQDLGLGSEMWFLLALRKGCLLLMLSTTCLLHMQQPPLVNGHFCDMNCSKMGHFGLAVQHLGVAHGWGFC